MKLPVSTRPCLRRMLLSATCTSIVSYGHFIQMPLVQGLLQAIWFPSSPLTHSKHSRNCSYCLLDLHSRIFPSDHRRDSRTLGHNNLTHIEKDLLRYNTLLTYTLFVALKESVSLQWSQFSEIWAQTTFKFLMTVYSTAWPSFKICLLLSSKFVFSHKHLSVIWAATHWPAFSQNFLTKQSASLHCLIFMSVDLEEVDSFLIGILAITSWPRYLITHLTSALNCSSCLHYFSVQLNNFWAPSLNAETLLPICYRSSRTRRFLCSCPSHRCTITLSLLKLALKFNF